MRSGSNSNADRPPVRTKIVPRASALEANRSRNRSSDAEARESGSTKCTTAAEGGFERLFPLSFEEVNPTIPHTRDGWTGRCAPYPCSRAVCRYRNASSNSRRRRSSQATADDDDDDVASPEPLWSAPALPPTSKPSSIASNSASLSESEPLRSLLPAASSGSRSSWSPKSSLDGSSRGCCSARSSSKAR